MKYYGKYKCSNKTRLIYCPLLLVILVLDSTSLNLSVRGVEFHSCSDILLIWIKYVVYSAFISQMEQTVYFWLILFEHKLKIDESHFNNSSISSIAAKFKGNKKG